MKRSRSRSPGGTAAERAADSWRTGLVETFRALDTIIMTSRLSRKQVFVTDTLEPVERLSGLRFKWDDFDQLLAVCPAAFVLDWVPFTERRSRTTSALSHRLSVAVAEDWPHKSSRVSVAQRLHEFRRIVGTVDRESQLPKASVIPPKPEFGDGMISSSAAVAAVAMEALAAKRAEAVDIAVELQDSANKIESLKAAVMSRNAQKSAAAEKEAVSKAGIVRSQRLRALPAFCDLLRMLFNRRRRTVVATSECLRTLTAETKTSAEEYRWRIHAVCEIVPDFITIIAPDDISPMEHIKVNVYCNYADCMKRLQTYIDDAAETSSN